jgi:MFS family permease
MRSMSTQALREGIGFVWTHPVILSMMALDFGMTFFGQPRALMPVFARDILDVGPEGLGLMYSATSVGAISVAALMSLLSGVRRAGLLVLVGVGVFCVCTIVFGLSTIFWVSLLMLAGEGAGNSLGAVLRQTINQLSTPDELRGRVGSVNNIFTTSGPQFGQFRSGVVAELMGPEFSVVAGGFAALAVLTAITIAVPAVRRFEISGTQDDSGTRAGHAGTERA